MSDFVRPEQERRLPSATRVGRPHGSSRRHVTDTKHAPWYLVRSDDKKRARLNCISHLLEVIPYKKIPRENVKLPKRSKKYKYDDQATLAGKTFIPEKY